MPVAMLETAIAVGVLTLAVGLVAVVLLRLLPSLRLQLAGLAALSVCLPLASVLLSGWVAFHMGDDVKILAVSAGSATVAVVAGLVLARSIAGSVERVRDASARLAAGDLSVRAPESGPVEVADLATSFNEMAASLERLFDARRELVAWASHDLRTPLANMQAMLEALEDGLVVPETTLPVLREQVAVLSSLVDDLFELARIDAGSLTMELRDARLEPVIGSCLRGVEADARRRGIDLEASVPDGRQRAMRAGEGRAGALQPRHERSAAHTVRRIGRRPRRAGRPRGAASPSRTPAKASATRRAARMFDRFWRADPARSVRGSGLGLAIARGLVEAHGGRIWAEERPGGGARVSFTLPAAS